MHMHIVSNSPSLYLLIATPHPQPKTSKQDSTHTHKAPQQCKADASCSVIFIPQPTPLQWKYQNHKQHMEDVRVAKKHMEDTRYSYKVKKKKKHWAQCTNTCLYQAEDLPLPNHYLLFIKGIWTISVLQTTLNFITNQ